MEQWKKYLHCSILKLNHKQTLEDLDNIIHSLFSDESTGHDYDHTKRVVNLTSRFVLPQSNAFVALAIAYLHDVFDDKVNKVENLEIALRDFFSKYELDFDGYEDEIILGVSQIGYKGGFGVKNKTHEADLVSDADLMEAMGALGIARTFYYAGSKNTPLFKDTDRQRNIESIEDYRKDNVHALQHFDEKLLKLRPLIVTPRAQAMADRRAKVLRDFYDEFYLEIEESTNKE